MGIGTSLGAYFENDFDHHAGKKYKIDIEKDSQMEIDPNINDITTQDQNVQSSDQLLINLLDPPKVDIPV